MARALGNCFVTDVLVRQLCLRESVIQNGEQNSPANIGYSRPRLRAGGILIGAAAEPPR